MLGGKHVRAHCKTMPISYHFFCIGFLFMPLTTSNRIRTTKGPEISKQLSPNYTFFSPSRMPSSA